MIDLYQDVTHFSLFGTAVSQGLYVLSPLNIFVCNQTEVKHANPQLCGEVCILTPALQSLVISVRAVAIAHLPPSGSGHKAEAPPVLLPVLHREDWEFGQQVGFPLFLYLKSAIFWCAFWEQSKTTCSWIKVLKLG